MEEPILEINNSHTLTLSKKKSVGGKRVVLCVSIEFMSNPPNPFFVYSYSIHSVSF